MSGTPVPPHLARSNALFKGLERGSLAVQSQRLEDVEGRSNEISLVVADFREWDGPAVLPLPTALRVGWGFEARGARAMSRTTSAVAAATIGIDTGKNTLHLIGLDEQGMIVLREKLAHGRIRSRLDGKPRGCSQRRRGPSGCPGHALALASHNRSGLA